MGDEELLAGGDVAPGDEGDGALAAVGALDVRLDVGRAPVVHEARPVAKLLGG